MKKGHNDPYLSETYCSDEEYFEYLEESNSEGSKKPEEKDDQYLSETYCSDEEYHDHVQKQKES